ASGTPRQLAREPDCQTADATTIAATPTNSRPDMANMIPGPKRTEFTKSSMAGLFWLRASWPMTCRLKASAPKNGSVIPAPTQLNTRAQNARRPARVSSDRIYTPRNPSVSSTKAPIPSAGDRTQEVEANACAPRKDDSSEKGRTTGNSTKSAPERARATAPRRIRNAFLDSCVIAVRPPWPETQATQ